MFETKAQIMAKNKTMTPIELSEYASEIFSVSLKTLFWPTAEEVKTFSDFVKDDALKMLKAFHGLSGTEAMNYRLSFMDRREILYKLKSDIAQALNANPTNPDEIKRLNYYRRLLAEMYTRLGYGYGDTTRSENPYKAVTPLNY